MGSDNKGPSDDRASLGSLCPDIVIKFSQVFIDRIDIHPYKICN
jgi:hypothetical protein